MGTDGRARLIESLRDKEYRHHFASAGIRRGLAEQIREMRLDRGWTQADLARASGKVQETISQLENPNYGSYTLKTLQRLGEAFDVALIVRFAPFSQLADWIAGLSPQDLAVPDFDHDPGLRPPIAPSVHTASTGSGLSLVRGNVLPFRPPTRDRTPGFRSVMAPVTGQGSPRMEDGTPRWSA